MFFFQYRKRVFRPLLFLITGLFLSLAILLSYSITVYADDPSAPASSDPAGDPTDPSSTDPASDPPEPSIRTSDAPSAATVSLTHTHRGSSHTAGQCFTVPVYHRHSGNSSSGGACYSPVYHSHNSSCYRSCSYDPVSWTVDHYENTECTYHGDVERVVYSVRIRHYGCGLDVEDRIVAIDCPTCGGTPEAGLAGTHYYLSCNLEGTVAGYNRTCGRTEGVTVDYYNPGCGLEVRSYGDISLNNSTPEWTAGNVTLTGSLNDPEGVISDGGFGVMNFRAESGEIVENASDSITVSENGIYVMDITVDETRFDTASASVMLNVSNIDRTPPTINEVSYDQGDTWLHSNEITVTASDPQPDGTPGSGLADEAYSFDGGSTWQSSPTFSCTENGTVEIRVRDYCGNIAETSVEITNVDNSGPDVSYIFTPTIWYEGDAPRQYTFNATDEESGLPEFPFSYDGGETWTDEIRLAVSGEKTITVLVRDSLDNITEITIVNKHDIRPKEDTNDGGGGGGDGDGNEDNDNSDGSADEDSSDSGNTSDPGNGDYGKTVGNDKETTEADPEYAGTHDVSSGRDNSGSQGDGDSMSSAGNDMNNTDQTDADNDSSVYFEQLPTSSAGIDIPGQDTLREHTPFYRTVAFKAVASVGGGLIGASILTGLFLLLYSGVIIYTYDGNKYRLTGIRPIRRSERGNYIFLSSDFMDNAYSSKYKMALGPVYVKRHADDLLSINADGDWTAVNVERYIYTIL